MLKAFTLAIALTTATAATADSEACFDYAQDVQYDHGHDSSNYAAITAECWALLAVELKAEEDAALSANK